MNTKRLVLWVGATLLAMSSISAQAVPALYDYGFNIDGTVSMPFLGDPVPGEVNLAGFDDITGLGAITVTITGAGAHSFDAFFDHEIDEAINTFFNESGAATGAVAVGQSWEIDEPGFLFGDIYTNFEDSILDNFNNVPSGLEDDVSMAMGWDFNLLAGETATISLLLSDVLPVSGFFLTHADSDSQYEFYLSSSLRIGGGGVPTPEPSILLLLGIGLAGMAVNRRRKNA